MSTDSTVTVQDICDLAQTFGDIEPVLNVGGFSKQPALTIANDVMNAICGAPFPHKWNEINLPVFYTNSYQQDYALINPDGTSVITLSWLERGIVININSTSLPKAYRQVECGRQLPQSTGGWWCDISNPAFLVNWFPNKTLYYGTWGSGNTGNASFGNNPVAGSVYTNPLTVGNMPANPILQIRDANQNLLVLTTYGAEGSTAPLASVGASPGTVVFGTGATTRWTVIDPNGQGIRILPVPAQTGNVWEFNLTGQLRPVRFASLDQTLSPLPDELEPNFRQGFITQCYRYSKEQKIRDKFTTEWQIWMKDLFETRAKSDREQEENMFVPDRGIMGSGSRRSGWAGAAWPFNNPFPF